jgi:protein-S-isoprenylcysteine O-methyltransferase Ste14
VSRRGHRHERQRRDDLVDEHPWGDGGQIVLALLFFAVWISDVFLLHYTTWLTAYVPLFVRIPIGTALLLVAVWLAQSSLRIVFGEVRPEPCVIRKGVFGLVRHPIYLSEVLLYLGLLVLDISLAAAAVLVIAFAFVHFISRYEEKQLLDRFGAEYRQYMADVPMWIPRIRRRCLSGR